MVFDPSLTKLDWSYEPKLSATVSDTDQIVKINSSKLTNLFAILVSSLEKIISTINDSGSNWNKVKEV